MAKIVFDDKQDLNQVSDIPDLNKVTADNINEIKKVVNENYDDLLKKIEESGGGSGTPTPSKPNVPLGTIVEWFSDTFPEDFMPINGQAISRTTYKDLFGIIGTSYGEGDGKTTFNLPNQNAGIEDIEDPSIIPKFTYIMRVL